MIRKFLVILTILFFSFVILFISITQTAQIKYAFNGVSNKAMVLGDEVNIEYHFPYPGRILPDHPLWPLKALRDRIWILVTPKAERRAELKLLFANKRIVSSKLLLDADKPELALSVLTKAEKYLEASFEEEETARKNGVNTQVFLYSLNLASLKHRQMIKESVIIAPDDAKPEISKTENIAKNIYEQSKTALDEVGVNAPKDPWEGDN